jgi:hypothetical protein
MKANLFSLWRLLVCSQHKFLRCRENIPEEAKYTTIIRFIQGSACIDDIIIHFKETRCTSDL